MKKIYLILAVVLILLIVALILLSTGGKSPSVSPQPTNTITPIPIITIPKPGQSYIDQANKYGQDSLSDQQKSQHLADFRNSLPYTGTYITVQYNIKTNSYIVTIDSNNKAASSAELDLLLQKYQVDKSLISPNLIINYK